MKTMLIISLLLNLLLAFCGLYLSLELNKVQKENERRADQFCIRDIEDEIDKQTEIHSDGEFYIKNINVKRILDKHISRK